MRSNPLASRGQALVCLLGTVLLSACRPEPPDAPLTTPAAAPPVSTEPIPVDVREPLEFAKGHEPGAINLQMGYGQLRLRAKDLFGASPLRLVAKDESQRDAAVKVAEGVGCDVQESAVYDPSAGPVGKQDIETAGGLYRRLSQPDPPLVLDVRTVKELESGYIAGAVYLYPNVIHPALEHLRRDRSYAVICEEGWRSSTVASAMVRAGFPDVCNVIDGMKGWRQAGYPMLTAKTEADYRLVP